jgi:uncharacterized protein
MDRLDSLVQTMTRRLQQGLAAHYHYHSPAHTLDVMASALRIAKAEGIDDLGIELLQVAALYHDSGYLKNAVEHEVIGCNYVRAELPAVGFSTEEVELICGMIMATRYPQQPTNPLEQILCDADLDYLGRPDFYAIADKLRLELSETGKLTTEEEWIKLQVGFLSQHGYFTKTAKETRDSMKSEHLSALMKKLM